MFAPLVVAAVLACRPMPVPPPTTASCEGADRVSRNHDGLEVRRDVNACTVVRCEGADQVRRTLEGAQVSRSTNACTVTRCEGFDMVRRSNDGVVLGRIVNRCGPPQDVYVRRQASCEGSDFVVRNRFGAELSRDVNASRCRPADTTVAFGLSAR
ncbi:MAG: hypothetical protein ACO1OB_02915 [Archangium sp.]